jgi:hypothetical protein
MGRRFFLNAIFAWVAVLAGPPVAFACSVCVAGASNDPTADAFKWSVLFLMATPYAVVGAIAGWLFYIHRRAAAKRAGSEREKPVRSLVWKYKENQR